MSIAEKLTTIAENQQRVYDAAYDKSKNDFWDVFQNYGERKGYQAAFREWGSAEIAPKHQVKPSSSYITNMFTNAKLITKLEAQHFDLSGATVSQTNANNGNRQVFMGCSALVEIEDIGLPAGYYSETFSGCTSLETIAILRFDPEGTTKVSGGAFTNCTSLANINEISGVIGVDINFQACPLTLASAMSIIAHLSRDVCGTITFSDTTKGYLNSAGNSLYKDKDNNPISWIDYMRTIGPDDTVGWSAG